MGKDPRKNAFEVYNKKRMFLPKTEIRVFGKNIRIMSLRI